MLVDNTRSDRLGSPDFWPALKCIRCGACMNACPVYRRGGGLSYGATYSGPIGVILDPGFDLSKYRELPFHSSLCGSCTEVCPVKIDISDQIYKWRHVVAEKGLLPLAKKVGMSAIGKTLAHPSSSAPPSRPGRRPSSTCRRLLLYNPINPWGRQTSCQQYRSRRSASGISRIGGNLRPRDAILEAVRRNLPRPALPLPEAPEAERDGVEHGLGLEDHLPRLPEVPGFADKGEPLLSAFRRQLEAMGGRSFEVADAAAARAKMADRFPDARVICSAVPEVAGTRRIEEVRTPHELDDVDVGVVRSPLGVAEAGGVWLTQGRWPEPDRAVPGVSVTERGAHPVRRISGYPGFVSVLALAGLSLAWVVSDNRICSTFGRRRRRYWISAMIHRAV